MEEIHIVSQLEWCVAGTANILPSKSKHVTRGKPPFLLLFSSPHVTAFVSAFETPSELILVMEYLSGGELFERVAAEDFELTEAQGINFMAQICRGVNYIHEKVWLFIGINFQRYSPTLFIVLPLEHCPPGSQARERRLLPPGLGRHQDNRLRPRQDNKSGRPSQGIMQKPIRNVQTINFFSSGGKGDVRHCRVRVP